MTTVTFKGFIMKTPYSGDFQFCGVDMSDHGYLMVGPHEFEYEMPAEFNPVVAEVVCLRQKLEKANKEHTDKVRMINDRIASLLCLENNPSQTADEMPDEAQF